MTNLTNLALVRGRVAGSRLPNLSATHWTADGQRTLCGLVAANRVNAMNPAKALSCRKCARAAAR